MSNQFVCDAPGCNNVDNLSITEQLLEGGFYCAAHQAYDNCDPAYADQLEQYDPDEHDDVINR